MSEEKREKKKNILILTINIFLFILMITMNALAVMLPLNGKSTGELSDKYPNLFVPAGITFSIWGLIYMLLVLYLGYQLIGAIKNKKKMTFLFNANLTLGLNFLLNATWIITWHYEYILLSFLVMLSLLGTLIYIFLKIEKQNFNSFIDYLFIKAPISVYLAWISVATIANVTVLLVNAKWTGFGISQNIWTIVVIILGTILALLMLYRHKNIPYALVFIWAYSGIIIKRTSQLIVYFDIVYTCYLMIALIAIYSLVILFVYFKENLKKKINN